MSVSWGSLFNLHLNCFCLQISLMSVNNSSLFLSQSTLLTADILTCHSRKSSGVINNIDDGCNCSSRAIPLLMFTCQNLQTNVISSTSALPAMTSQNLRCEKSIVVWTSKLRIIKAGNSFSPALPHWMLPSLHDFAKWNTFVRTVAVHMIYLHSWVLTCYGTDIMLQERSNLVCCAVC